MIEIAVNRTDGKIDRVDSNIPTRGYNDLLQHLLLGLRLDQVPAAIASFDEHLRGPLLKPTIAALTNAVSQDRTSLNGP